LRDAPQHAERADYFQTSPIDKLSVAFVIVLGVVVLGEPLSWKVVVGGSLVLAGVLVLAT
jgi:transporter family protein